MNTAHQRPRIAWAHSARADSKAGRTAHTTGSLTKRTPWEGKPTDPTVGPRPTPHMTGVANQHFRGRAQCSCTA